MKDLVRKTMIPPGGVVYPQKPCKFGVLLLCIVFYIVSNSGALAQSSVNGLEIPPDPNEAAGIIIISGKQYYGELGINTLLDFDFQSSPALSLSFGGAYRLGDSETFLGWEGAFSNTFLGRGTALCVPSGCPECQGPNPPSICQYLEESFQSTTNFSIKSVLMKIGRNYISELRFGTGYQFDAGKNVTKAGNFASIANSNSFTINYGVAIGIPIADKLMASFSLDGMNNLGSHIRITESGTAQESFSRKRLMILSPGLKLRLLF